MKSRSGKKAKSRVSETDGGPDARSPSYPPLIYRYLNEEEIKARPDLMDRSPSLFELSPF